MNPESNSGPTTPSTSPLLRLLETGRPARVVASGGQCLQGPAFSRDGSLFVVDVDGGWICRVVGSQLERIFRPEGPAAPKSLAFHADGRLFVADRLQGCYAIDVASSRVESILVDANGTPFNGLKDLAFDSRGNLWLTDPQGSTPMNPTGAVYRATAASSYRDVRKVVSNIAYPNGIKLSADDRCVYVSETRKNRVWRVLVDGDGEPSAMLASSYFLSGNGPDGLALDEVGRVYVAHFQSGGVYVLSPLGEILEFIRMPSGLATTNVAFQPGSRCLHVTESSGNKVYAVTVDAAGLALFGNRP